MNDTDFEENGTDLTRKGLSFQLDTFQLVLHPIVICISVPLNLFVGYVLLSDKQLHNVRNSIWCGIVASNFKNLFTASLQQFFIYKKSYTACRLLTVLFSKAYIVLLIHMLLATLERFVYTRWPLFHQVHVTVWRVATAQICLSVGFFLGLSISFVSGMRPIRCGLGPQNGEMLKSFVCALVIVCIVAKLLLYLTATKLRNRQIIAANAIKMADLRNQNPEGQRHKTPRAHRNGRRIRQMERDATVTQVANLIPMIVIVSFYCIYLLIQVICKHFFHGCETLHPLDYHDLLLLHVSTDLLVYIFRSGEFRSAARRIFRRPTQN